MLLVGQANALQYITPNYNPYQLVILNLSSLVEGYDKVALMPPYNIDFLNDDTFDMEYMNYIFNNDTVFLELMKIIIPLYTGQDVFIIVNRSDDNLDVITESLLNIIRQRYGYRSYIINDILYDIEYLDNIIDMGDFSINGLSCLDQDKIRYESLIMQQPKLAQKEYDKIHMYETFNVN